jgi:hypothetical protein
LGSPALPGVDFSLEQVAIVNPLVKTLLTHDADLDLCHVEPTRMARCVVELQTSQYPARFVSWEGLIDG